MKVWAFLDKETISIIRKEHYFLLESNLISVAKLPVEFISWTIVFDELKTQGWIVNIKEL